MLSLVAVLACGITVATFSVVLAHDLPDLDRLTDARSAARLAHQGMLDQETGLRGWLLTGDRSFLAPYTTGVDETARGEHDVRAQVGNNSSLAPLLLDARLAEQAWTRGWAQPLLDLPAHTAANPATLAQGKRLFDTYRSADDRLSAGIDGQVDSTRDRMRLSLEVGGALLLLGIAALVVLILREHRRLRTMLLPTLAGVLDAVRRVRDGDLQARAPQAGPREVSELAAGVNEMAAALSEEHAARASRETEALYQATKLREVLEMARDLAGSLDVRYVLDATASHAVTMSGFDQATVWLVDEDRPRLHALHSVTAEGPVTTDRQPLDMNVGCVGRAARSGRVATHTGPERAAPPGTHTLTAVPMLVGTRVIGVIELASRREMTLHDTVLEMLEALAAHAGVAVDAARMHQRTEEQSHVDALTRLFNRRRLQSDLEKECKSSRRYGRALSFCMIDVDHFKDFNDREGHRRGDEVLEEVARVITAGIRTSDTAYRYGGEEFALLLRDTPVEAAMSLCERLRVRIAARFATGPDVARITASFGVASFSDDHHGPAALVEHADRALYEAKRTGRNRCVAAEAPPDLGGQVVPLR